MKPHLSLLMALALTALPAQAGPGHDHGDDAPASTGTALPRFALTSDLFELVGVLDGTTLTLHLDRSASNEPVTQADIELELAGASLRPKAQADGSFVVALRQPLGEGVHAVAATVTVGEEADLLAGELDLHGEAPHDDGHAPAGWKRWGLVLLGVGGVGFVALALWTWRRRQRAASFGAAA